MGEREERKFEPVVPASQRLPEITVKAILLGVVLAVILAGANAYLGLFAGMTVSASIPAAVISMAVFSLFKRSNILENNIVQTAASAGEAVAAAAVFTLPGLVILGFWKEYDYLQTLLICALGGTIGVLFSVPLRRALVVHGGEEIKFPEGIATGEILKAGQAKGGGGLGVIVGAGLAGGLMKLCQEAGLRLFSDTLRLGGRAFGSVAYFGANLSPALMGVGYIVGLNVAVLIFLGGSFSWWLAIPLYGYLHGVPADGAATDAARAIWASQIRYIGVGAMCVGGVWALINLRSQLMTGVRSGLSALKDEKDGGAAVARTDRDIPMFWVLVCSALAVIPLFFVYKGVCGSFGVSAVMAVIMLVAGFLFAAVAGYMAGLVGSSNNPISGVTISTILFASLVLLLFLGHGNPAGPAAAILIGAVVCCAASISGDNLQDLKAGYLVGATPWKQEFMLVVGVLASSFVIAPVLKILELKYGVGIPLAADEAWHQAHPNPLGAPQATLMASVSKGVFMGGLPWTMVAIGGGIAVCVIALDLFLKSKGSKFRTPVLAVAVGIYLPFDLDLPILTGGLIAFFADRLYRRYAGTHSPEEAALARAAGEKRGLLFASGLISGEALMGILVAAPITLASVWPTLGGDFLALFHEPPFGPWPGVVLMALLVVVLHRMVTAPCRRAP